MRCPNCNKWPTQEPQEPEVQDVTIGGVDNGPLFVHAEVRVVVACADCSEELKENNFETDVEVTVPAEHAAHDLNVGHQDAELVDDLEGKGQRKRRFFGYRMTVGVFCGTCGLDDPILETEITDRVQSSHMDELV